MSVLYKKYTFTDTFIKLCQDVYAVKGTEGVQDVLDLEFSGIKAGSFIRFCKRFNYPFIISEEQKRLLRGQAIKRAKASPEAKERDKIAKAAFMHTDEFRKNMSLSKTVACSDPDYRKKLSLIHKKMWRNPDYRSSQLEACAGVLFEQKYNWPSKDDWELDVNGIRSQFESLLAEEGHFVAYSTCFPGIPYTSVQKWFRSIPYKFQDLLVYNTHRSNIEFEVEAYLKSLGIKCFHASAGSTIPGRELDLYLPDLSIAMEFNGLYHHRYDSTVERQYYKTLHRVKADLCSQKGILLYYLWDFISNDRNLLYSFIDKIVDLNYDRIALAIEYSSISPFILGFEIDRDFYSYDFSGLYILQDPKPLWFKQNNHSFKFSFFKKDHYSFCYNSGIWVPLEDVNPFLLSPAHLLPLTSPDPL
jgi:hypothetical protein